MNIWNNRKRVREKIVDWDLFNDESGKLNVKISKDEVAKLVKEYKKAMKYRKSNLFQASQLLVDKNGRQL